MGRKGKKIIQHFQKHDKILFSIIKQSEFVSELQSDEPENYFFRLCREIVGQQLADKASKTIFARFEKLFSTKKITPRKALKLSHQAIRKSGLSNAKARYIKNLAKKVISKELNFGSFKNLSDEQIIEKLTVVKGIGPWTSEMFLMFTLAREDVFSHRDLGLRKAIKKLYGFKKELTREQIEKISSKWRPYRTYACLILWKSIENS